VIQWRAGEVFVVALIEAFFLKHDAARSVTGATVAQALHQIGAAIPGVALVRVGFVAVFVQHQEVPNRQRPTGTFNAFDFIFQVGLIDRLHFVHKVVIQRAHVLFGDFGVGRIRHRRVEIVAILRETQAHRIIKILKRVITDAGFRIRRDIGGVNVAEHAKGSPSSTVWQATQLPRRAMYSPRDISSGAVVVLWARAGAVTVSASAVTIKKRAVENEATVNAAKRVFTDVIVIPRRSFL